MQPIVPQPGKNRTENRLTKVFETETDILKTVTVY